MFPAKEYQGNHGFVCRISHSDSADYLEMAYLQALSVKTTQKQYANYALIVDETTNRAIADRHRSVIDSIIVAEEPWSFAEEWRTRIYSPWRRTIKLDADLILVEDIAHWWDSFEAQRRNVVFPTVIENYRGEPVTSRWHRELFDRNLLPDIYTALYYFKDGADSTEFFTICKNVSENWPWFAADFLKKNTDPVPRDDEIFAIAAEIYGVERCTVPGAAYPRFVHFKEPLNELPAGKPWHEQLHIEHNSNLWIGHYPQRLPLHYCSKSFATPERVAQYEQNYRKLFSSNQQLSAT